MDQLRIATGEWPCLATAQIRAFWMPELMLTPTASAEQIGGYARRSTALQRQADSVLEAG
jgi:hypothetical protein